MYKDCVCEDMNAAGITIAPSETLSLDYSNYSAQGMVSIGMSRRLGDDTDVHDVLAVMANMLRAMGFVYVDKLVAVTPEGKEFVV